MRRTVEVWADWTWLGPPQRMGRLHAIATRGKEVFSFEYEHAWLQDKRAQVLDPALRLFGGPQYPVDGREIWGVFADSAPDRWGRVLLQRREAVLAREQRRDPRRLTELDYLLGVYDGHRMGGLRYCLPGGPFLDDNAELASPPWTSLAELEAASLRLDDADAERDPEFARWVRMLIAPGRSLGGSRPKASVLDAKKELWLAKFPSSSDTHDVGGWEAVLHVLARRAGIAVPETTAERFGSKHHTFLAKRFDRSDAGRTHFASAMTMLGQADGADGVSYLDIARVIVQTGAQTQTDLEQLWRRVVFNVCVSNADDHLRNHGFLLDPKGWRLSPAYDMNPIEDAEGLTLNLSEFDNTQSLELATQIASHFRVSAKRASKIINEVRDAIRGWDQEARKLKITRDERERMARAFRIADTRV